MSLEPLRQKQSVQARHGASQIQDSNCWLIILSAKAQDFAAARFIDINTCHPRLTSAKISHWADCHFSTSYTFSPGATCHKQLGFITYNPLLMNTFTAESGWMTRKQGTKINLRMPVTQKDQLPNYVSGLSLSNLLFAFWLSFPDYSSRRLVTLHEVSMYEYTFAVLNQAVFTKLLEY